MVIKKPYAFLIKKFRLIHAILFCMLLYLLISTFNLFVFFNDYASNNFIATLDLVSSYITLFTFIVCLLILVLCIAIYYLLNKKNKPKKIYLFSCVFYILLFIFFIVMVVLLKDLEYNTFSYEKIRVIRDICLLFIIPQIVIAFIVLGRTLGFNVKEFEFNKDLKDLEIDEKDYEEVEVTLGKDNYKYKREIRKSFRLFKYFLLENKFFITIVCSIFALTISLVIFLNLRIYNLHYNESDEFVANAVWYTANDSYLAYKDIYGNEIATGRYYLLIKMNLRNKLNTDVTVDRNTFRLKLSGELYIPKFTYGQEFLDVGEVFTQTTLKAGESKDVVIVFELDETQIKKEYLLRVKNASNISIGELNSEYIDIVIKPKNINNNVDSVTYTIPNKIDLSNTILGNTNILVSSVEVADTFKEYYESCYNNDCSKYTYVVNPSGKNNAVLKIKSTVTVDNSVYISKYIKYPSNFFKYFAKIYYRYQGVTKKLDVTLINSTYGKEEYTYIEVPEKMKEANKIEMLIDIRGVKYTLVLK